MQMYNVPPQGGAEEKGKLKIKDKALKEFRDRYQKILAKRENGTAKILYDEIKESYGIDEQVVRKVVKHLDPAFFPSFYPIETDGNILLYGPPGTGKSYLVAQLAKKSGAILLMGGNHFDAGNPKGIEMAFEQARKLRRRAVEMDIDQAIDDVGKDELVRKIADIIEENVKIKSREVVEMVVKDHLKELPVLLQPIDPAEVVVMENFIEQLNRGLEKKLEANDFQSFLNILLPGVPILIFIDEIDAVGERELGANPILNTLLREMDNGNPEINNGITLIGATNRIEYVDEALTRPGRLVKVLLPYPTPKGRKAIAEVIFTKTKASKIHMEDEELIKELIGNIPLLTGSDIMGIINNIIKAKRSETIGRDTTVINEGVVREYLVANRDELGKAFRQDAAQVGNYDMLLKLILGEDIDEPLLKKFLVVMENVLADEEIVKLLKEKGDEEKAARLVAPGRELLQNLEVLLLANYIEGKGMLIAVRDQEVAEEISKELSLRSARAGLAAGVEPLVKIEADASRLLGGIVGSTVKSVKHLFEHMEMLPPTIIVIKNHEALYSVGEYTHEHAGVYEDYLRKLKDKGHVILYVDGIKAPLVHLQPDIILEPLVNDIEARVMEMVAAVDNMEEIVEKIKPIIEIKINEDKEKLAPKIPLKAAIEAAKYEEELEGLATPEMIERFKDASRKLRLKAKEKKAILIKAMGGKAPDRHKEKEVK